MTWFDCTLKMFKAESEEILIIISSTRKCYIKSFYLERITYIKKYFVFKNIKQFNLHFSI